MAFAIGPHDLLPFGNIARLDRGRAGRIDQKFGRDFRRCGYLRTQVGGIGVFTYDA